jgi:phage-related protein
MDLIETVGARLVLMGQAEYVSGLTEATKALADLGTGAKTASVASDEMRAATVAQEAAQKELAASMQTAVAAQREYVDAQKAVVEANTAAAESDSAAARSAQVFAEAQLEAAAAARDAALVQVKAAEESAVAARSEAAAIEEAATAKEAAATRGKAAMAAVGVAVAVAAGAVAVESVKMAADFQSATERLVTSAGETQSNLDLVRQGILQMAGDVGYSADALATAMYKVESGGQHGADGLAVLRAAAEGAKTENADLTTVADALTSALTDYHLPASSAADVTSKLVAATASGKMTFEELAGSMSNILPVASANHVALNDVLGDLASMTMHGMSAQQASDNLADAIRHMASPTQMQSKEFATLGLTVQQVQQSLGTNGLSGTVNMIGDAIRQHLGPDASKVVLDLGTALKNLPAPVQELGQKLLDGSVTYKQFVAAAKDMDPIAHSQAMSFATLAGSFHQVGNEQMSGAQAYQTYSGALRQAMGDATGMNVALMIGGENAKNTAGAIDAVSKATADGAGNVKGWDEIQGTFNQKLSEAKSSMGSLAISIGTVLLPAVTTLVGWIATSATWLSQHQGVAIALATVIAGVLVGALVIATIALWGMVAPIATLTVVGAPLWAIILAIVAAVALLAFGAYELISHWDAVAGFFVGLWNGIKSGAETAWNWVVGVAQSVAGGIVSAWNAVSGFFSGVFHAIGEAAQWLWNTVLSPVFDAIGLAARVLIAVIVTILVTPFVIAFHLLGDVAVWLYNVAIKPAWDGIQSAISTVWNWLNANVFQPIGAAITAVGNFFTQLWQQYVVPAWNGIQNAISTVWNWLQANVIAPINLAIALLGMTMRLLWQQYVVPAWQGIQNAINTAWQWINNNVFTPIRNAIIVVGNAFSDFWHNVIVPVWNGIQNAISAAWQWIDQNVFTPFKAGIALLGTAFQDAKNFIGQVWTEVEQAVATPIHWVVDVVYTNGIKAVWDKVADFVSLPHLPDAPQFAGGGVLGGYAPGVDTIPAMLSPGEAVLVPELVAAIGPDAIMAMNAHYSGGRPGTMLGGFSGGGVVHAAGGAAPDPGGSGNSGNFFTNAVSSIGSAVGSAVSTVGNAVGSIVGSITDFLSDPVGMAGKWLHEAFDSLAGGASSPVAKVAYEVPGKAIDGLIDKVKSWWQAMQAAAAAALGAVPGAPAAAGGNVGLVQAMAAARGWTGAQWDALYAVIMRESGFNNNAQNPTSTAYGMFQFLDGTWGAYGASKTSDPSAQTAAGLNYIASRYGSPEGALAHEQTYGWYSGGGVALPIAGARANGGPVSTGFPYLVGERGPELFVPASDGTVINSSDTTTISRSLGGTQVIVQPGAVVIHQASDPHAVYEATMQGLSDAIARR